MPSNCLPPNWYGTFFSAIALLPVPGRAILAEIAATQARTPRWVDLFHAGLGSQQDCMTMSCGCGNAVPLSLSHKAVYFDPPVVRQEAYSVLTLCMPLAGDGAINVRSRDRPEADQIQLSVDAQIGGHPAQCRCAGRSGALGN